MRLILAILLFAFGASAQMPPRVLDDLMMALPKGSSSTLLDGLVGFWKFNETSGTNVADSSGNGRTGDVYGTGMYWSTGKIGNCLSNFTVNGYVAIPNITNNNITAAGWFYVMSTANPYGGLFSQYSGSGNRSWLIDAGNVGTAFGGYISIGNVLKGQRSVAGAVLTNQWAHLCLTYDGSNIKFYTNGVINFTVPQTGNIDSSTAVISFGSLNGVTRINLCSFDECGLWNRALTQAEVTELYNSGAGKTLP